MARSSLTAHSVAGGCSSPIFWPSSQQRAHSSPQAAALNQMVCRPRLSPSVLLFASVTQAPIYGSSHLNILYINVNWFLYHMVNEFQGNFYTRIQTLSRVPESANCLFTLKTIINSKLEQVLAECYRHHQHIAAAVSCGQLIRSSNKTLDSHTTRIW